MATKSIPAASAGTPEAAAAAIVDWFDTHCRNTVISRDTDAYNKVRNHVEGIRAALSSMPKEG